MARYDHEFVGIPAEFARPTGLDPNYRGGYRGMRMQGRGGNAPYGAHRLSRRYDLETAGGFPGIHPSYDRDFRDWRDWDRGGGVRDYDREPELMRGFNSRSPDLRDERRFYGREVGRRVEWDHAPGWLPRHPYNPEYTNRGIPPAGYSEGWARGPMRGSR